ncbi:peroxin-5, partial [Tremellales sp. Uapishka_1]
MQSLLNGTDCSASVNPLNQVLKREGVDNSLFRDRSAPSSSAGPSQVGARAFLPLQHQYQSQPHSNAQTPHPFNLSHLSAALASSSQLPAPALDAEWHRARQANLSQPQHRQAAPSPGQHIWQTDQSKAWVQGFQDKGKQREYAHSPGTPTQRDYSQAPPTNQQYMPYQPRFQPMYSQMTPPYQPQPQSERLVQIPQNANHEEMEAAFERALKDAQAQNAQPQAGGVQEGDGIEDRGESRGELDKIWESLRPEAERLNKLAEWERDFSQFTNGEDDDYDLLNESLMQEPVGQAGLDEQFELMRELDSFENEDGVPKSTVYEFAINNKYIADSPVLAWAEANQIMSAGGSLSDAALYLESVLLNATPQEYSSLQTDELAVWTLLGRCHAMNEKEEKALQAFEEARSRLEGNTSVAGELLTNLAISYVNESLDLAALTTLHQFLSVSHAAFATAPPSRSRLAESTDANPWKLHLEMTDAFMALAKSQYQSKGTVDATVQVGLGTLYYMMGEYTDARECWVNALNEKPDDYLLWNRLGATLANSGNPEEAVDAYRRALELKPTFTRAIFNLGVACLNIGVYREAAEHFLAALSLHPAPESMNRKTQLDAPATLWMTLRRALIALDMPELAERANPETNLNVFKQAGFEF